MNPMISHRNRQDRGADCKDLRRDIYNGYRRVGSVFNDNRSRVARPIRDDDFLWSASVIRRLRMDPIQDSAPPGNLPVITFPLLAVSGRYRGVAQVTGAVVSCRTCPGVAARRPPGRAPGQPKPPLHSVGQPGRYDENRRVHSNRPSGPKGGFL